MLSILQGIRDSMVRRSVSLLLKKLRFSGETSINYLVTQINTYLQEPLQNSSLFHDKPFSSSSNRLHFEKDTSHKQAHKKVVQITSWIAFLKYYSPGCYKVPVKNDSLGLA